MKLLFPRQKADLHSCEAVMANDLKLGVVRRNLSTFAAQKKLHSCQQKVILRLITFDDP